MEHLLLIKAKTIYINLGYDDPIKEGLRFDVVEDGILEGHNIETKIGEIRITEKVSFKKWFFGCYHMDKVIPPRYYALFEKVLPFE